MHSPRKIIFAVLSRISLHLSFLQHSSSLLHSLFTDNDFTTCLFTSSPRLIDSRALSLLDSPPLLFYLLLSVSPPLYLLYRVLSLSPTNFAGPLNVAQEFSIFFSSLWEDYIFHAWQMTHSLPQSLVSFSVSCTAFCFSYSIVHTQYIYFKCFFYSF